MRLKDRVAVVTGSTRGIGKAVALAFAREGASVVVNGRDPARGMAVVREIEALGRPALWVQADVAELPQIERLFAATRERFGRVDVLVNNAGIFQRRPCLEITEEDWDRMLATNLKSAFFCSQIAARMMVEQGGGNIIMMSSDAAWSGGINPCAHYCVTKSGMCSLTRSFAKELAGFNIRVNAIAPGMIISDMGEDAMSMIRDLKIPLGRMGSADEVAAAAVFLASDESSYMTGATLNLSAGLILDR